MTPGSEVRTTDGVDRRLGERGPFRSGRPRNGLLISASIGSGALLAVAYGLQPVPFAAWLGPIPLLIAAGALGARTATALGAATGAVASVSLFAHLAELDGPGDALLLSAVRAAQWAFIALIAQRSAVRLPLPVAVFAAPTALAATELIMGLLSPHGAAGSLATSQLDLLPVAQLAALGGGPAIAFVILLGANIAAYLLLGPRRPVRVLGVPLLVLLLALGWGGWRVVAAAQHPPSGPVVALLGGDGFDGSPRDWEAVWTTYSPRLVEAADAGAEIAILPEKIVRLDDATREPMLDAVRSMARTTGLTIVVGVVDLAVDGSERNRLFAIGAGQDVTAYDKRHLVPGLETGFSTGRVDAPATLAGTSATLLICTDLDFPRTVRGAATDADAGLLVVPAWEVGEDARSPSRTAMQRGIENGATLVRAAREGELTVSSPTGAVVAEAATTDGVQLIIAQVPDAERRPTLYALVGETFGWLSVLATLVLLGAVSTVDLSGRRARRRPRAGRAARSPRARGASATSGSAGGAPR